MLGKSQCDIAAYDGILNLLKAYCSGKRGQLPLSLTSSYDSFCRPTLFRSFLSIYCPYVDLIFYQSVPSQIFLNSQANIPFPSRTIQILSSALNFPRVLRRISATTSRAMSDLISSWPKPTIRSRQARQDH